MSFRRAPLLPWSSRSCGGSGGMTASRRVFLPSRSSPPSFLCSFSFVPSSLSLSPTSSSPSSSPFSSSSSASLFCAAYDSARRSCSCVTFPDAPWICCTPSRAPSPACCCCGCSTCGQSMRWRSSGSNSRSCGSRNSSNNNSGYTCNNTRRCWSARRKSVSDGGRGSGGGLAFSATNRESERHSRASSLLLLRRMSHACPSLQKQEAVTSAGITCATSLFRDSAAAASAFFLLPGRGAELAFASAAELRRPAGVATAHRSKRRSSCQREQSNAQAARAAAATADVGAVPAGSAPEEEKAAATAGEAGAAGEVGLPEGAAATAAAAQVVVAAGERAGVRPAGAAAVGSAAAATEREKKKERSQRWKTGPVKRETPAKILRVREAADNGVCGRVVDNEREETRRGGETTERKEKRAAENQPAISLRRQQAARTAVCWTPRAAAAAATTASLLPGQGVPAASASSSFSSSPPRSVKAANSRPLVAHFDKVPSPLQASGQVIAAPVVAACAAAAAPAARCAPALWGAVPLFDGPAAASAAPAPAAAVPFPVASAPQGVAAAHVVGPLTREAVPASFSPSPVAVAADERVSPAVDAPASTAARGIDCLRRYPATAAASPFRASSDFTAEGAFVFLPAVEGHWREFLSSFSSFSSLSSSHPPVQRAAAAALPSSAAAAAAPRGEGVAAAAQFAVAASSSLRTTNAAAGAATPAAAATTIVATAAAAIATATPAIAAAATGPPHVAPAASPPVTAGLCNPAAAAAAQAAPARRASFYAAPFSPALCGKIPATSPATVLPAAVGAAVFSSLPCSSCPSPFPSAVLTQPSGGVVAAPPAACASLSTNTSSISPAAAAFCLPAFPSSPAPAAVAAARGSIDGASSRPFTSAKGPSCSPSSSSLPSSFCTFFAASCSSAFSAFRPFPSAMPRCSFCAHGAAGPFLRRGSPLRRSSCGGSSPALFSAPSSCASPRSPPYLSSTFSSCRTLFSTSFLSRFSPHFPSSFLPCASVSSASSASISSPSSDRASGSPLRASPATESRGSERGSLSPLRAEELQVQPKLLSLLSATPDPARLGFGQFYTDHMIEVDWDDVYGWYSPVLRPLAPVSVHPGVSALHYAISAFEGLKAFRAADDRLLLFRPHDHARRLVSSCTRVTLPSFSADALVKLCKQLVRIDSRFVFPAKGLSLYLRPIVFSTYPTLGVHPPRMAKMLIIACPTSGYFSNAGEGTHLYVEQEYRRSWPGSAGSHKVAANYAPSILPCKVRMQQGFQQLLWTAPAAVPPPPLPAPPAAPPSLQGEERAAAAAAVERGAAKQAAEKSEGSEVVEERAAITDAAGSPRSTTAAAGNGRAAGEGQLLAARSEAAARTEAAGEATQREGGRRKAGEKEEEVGGNRRRTAECPGARTSRKERETAGGTAAAVASRAARAAAVQQEEEAAGAGEREGERGGELVATAGEENDLLWCEGGAMSIFILWKNEKGEEELATPALERDLILPGIMRDTVLHIARGYPNITVTERRILMRRDFLRAYEEGRVREIFCTGTGAVVIPVAVLHFEGRNFNCMPSDRSASLARRLLHDVYKIQYGEVPHHFVEEC